MVKTERWLDSSKVREMCIRYQYYTHGDCEAYDKMLRFADNLNVENLEGVKEVAIDIYHHSSLRDMDDCTPTEFVEGLMYGLLTECTEMYVEIVGEEVER